MEDEAQAFLSGFARDLVRKLATTDVLELDLETPDGSISFRRALTVAPAEEATRSDAPAPEAPAQFTLTSPVVGWFRRSAAPQGPPIVEPGDAVTAGQRVAVIEAVEVIHDVAVESAGVIAEVLVADGQGVEYGQPLFLVRAAE